MKKSVIVILVVILILCAVITAAVKLSDRPAGPPGGARKIQVVTTLFPLYDMASSIGADKAQVSLLLPPGVEPHSFEPKPGDMVRINEADIFIYTGAFMEPWAEEIIGSVTNKNLLVLDAGRSVKLAPGTRNGRAGAPDPHIWLDFDNAKAMADVIAAAFEKKDAANAAVYRQGLIGYKAGLSALDDAYRNGLASCRTRKVVYGGHYALAYISRRYGLEYSAAQGLSPDSEPTAKDLAGLVEQVREHDIRCIFYEELASPGIAETIAGETGAKMLPLNAAHNLGRDQALGGVSFFDILRKNLDNLREGLECR